MRIKMGFGIELTGIKSTVYPSKNWLEKVKITLDWLMNDLRKIIPWYLVEYFCDLLQGAAYVLAHFPNLKDYKRGPKHMPHPVKLFSGGYTQKHIFRKDSKYKKP